jgi:imidazolonepropionase-like amidohydrolase
MKGRISRLLVVSALVLTIAGCGPNTIVGEGPAKPETRPTAASKSESDKILAVINGTLIDGTGADPLRDAALVIQEGRVLAVGPRAAVSVPDDARIIDVQGSTILPGFINAHVHLGFDEEKLETWAQGGVTTVRDLGAYPSADLFSHRDALLKDNRYARLVAAGPIVTVPEGYPMVPWGFEGLPVTSPEDAASKINGLLDDGADVIKIAVEGGYIFRTKIPVLSAEEAAAIVSVAHERGTVVSAHVTASQDLGRALDAGVDDIAHMVTNPVYDGLIEHMLENDVYWVPTLELWKNVGYGDRRAIANLAKFVKAGGKVALGTDYAGYNAEFDLGMPITEIELMQKAGMTPMQIIVAGTKNAAHVCNLDHELGTLEAGKIADVLVVDGDPLEDIHALTNVRMVLHNGVVIRIEGKVE